MSGAAVRLAIEQDDLAGVDLGLVALVALLVLLAGGV